jgi:hypothetical protein
MNGKKDKESYRQSCREIVQANFALPKKTSYEWKVEDSPLNFVIPIKSNPEGVKCLENEC